MERDSEENSSRPTDLTRREVISWMAASVASLIAGTRMASSQHTSTSVQMGKKGIIKIDAKPSTITIDLASTAVIVVDMQNDFGSKGGMLDRNGVDITMIRRAVPPTVKVIAAGRESGMKIIFLKMAFKPDLSDLGPPDSPNGRGHRLSGVGTRMRAPDGTEGRILIRDTWNTEILSELKPETRDIQIYKHRYSGFFETDLDATLKRLSVRNLVFTGCTTSVCVESTIRDAMFRDYSPILLEDCTGEPLGNDLPRSNHEASLFLIAGRFGWVSSLTAFLEAIEAPVTSS
jgi:ureidoacrylate peracid hydrolase